MNSSYDFIIFNMNYDGDYEFYVFFTLVVFFSIVESKMPTGISIEKPITDHNKNQFVDTFDNFLHLEKQIRRTFSAWIGTLILNLVEKQPTLNLRESNLRSPVKKEQT